MPRAILLLHRTPDGDSHYDWLLAPGDDPREPDDRILISFRVADRIDRMPAEQVFEAERMADHRQRYLTCEGEISSGRGSVERIAAGRWTPRSIEIDVISGEIEWEGQSLMEFEGCRIETSHWRFQIGHPHRR